MKKNMKLMNIYEIQKNHELHKRKLSSITSINTKHKTYQSVYSNIEKINTFKKNKVYTECFIQKQRKSRIQFENRNLHRKMLEVHQRHQLNTKESQRKVTSEGKRYRNSSMNERLVSENARIKERLMKTKGSFYGPTNQKKVKDTKKLSHQQQVIHLLEKHLKMKPKVVFPQISVTSRLKMQKLIGKQSVICPTRNKSQKPRRNPESMKTK